MYVCKKCHDKDERVIKCLIPFTHHSTHIKSKCDICGKVDVVTHCWAYNYLGIKGAISKCSSVKNATSEID
jgi:hypothetical protein